MASRPSDDDWTARHARTRPNEGRPTVVRVEAEVDDWARRHGETSR